MARILLAGVPAFGLINPALPLVEALTRAGHSVDVLLTEAFRDRVERCGATLLPHAFYLDGPVTSPATLARYGRRIFDDMTEGMIRLGSRYDAVVGAGMQPRLEEIERAVDRPVAQHLPVFLQNDRTARHFARICTGMPAPTRRVLASRAARRALGTALGPTLFGRRPFDLVSLLGPRSRTLTMTVASEAYQPFPEDFPGATFLGPSPTQRVPDPDFPLDRLRDHDGPVVYGTLGTVFNTWTPFFRTLVRAFGDTEALLVLTTGGRGRPAEIGPIPDNVIVRSFVPQTDILDHADVCFTHGGFGSATDAVLLGASPVLTPMGADQFFNAYRLAELGTGQVLTKDEFTVEAVRAAARRALGDGPHRGSLDRLRASFLDAGGPETGVRALEAVL